MTLTLTPEPVPFVELETFEFDVELDVIEADIEADVVDDDC
jgi:hypothetical protein